MLGFFYLYPISAFAQSQEEQQLKQQVQQLEQLTQELKARIAALEKTPATTQPAPSTPTTTQTTQTGPPKTTTIIVQQPSEASEVGPTEEKNQKSMDIYGFAQLDTGYDFGQNDPNWFDVMRPTKLPSFTGNLAGMEDSTQAFGSRASA